MALDKFSTDDLIAHRVKIKAEIEAREAELKAEMEPNRKKLAKLEGEIMRRMSEEELESFKGQSGTASRVLRTTYSIVDGEKFRDHVLEQGDISYFQRTLVAAAMKDYQEEHGELPPGIGASQSYSLRITPPRNK